jgi:hypothetical protein
LTLCQSAMQAEDTFTARLSMYAAHSALASGHWVKVKISKSGVYKITYAELEKMGFGNPAKVHVYGYGAEGLSQNLNAETYTDDIPEVNVYSGSDFILFYGQGPVKWSLNSNWTSGHSCFPYTFTKNPYSNYGYYFLSESDSPRSQISASDDVDGAATDTVTSYEALDLRMPETVNIAETGNCWYGDPITQSGSKYYSFTFDNMIADSTASARIINAAAASTSGSFTFSSGNSEKTTAVSSSISGGVASYEMGSISDMTLMDVAQNANGYLSFTSTYRSSSSSAVGYLYYLAVAAKCALRMSGSYMPFSSVNSVGSGRISDFFLSGAAGSTQIWNVTDPKNVRSVPCSSTTDGIRFRLATSSLLNLVAVNPSGDGFLSIDSYESVANQDLHAVKPVDLVIISPSKFVSQASELAELHQQNDGLTTLVVTPELIYNEFSSGAPDATSYRSFLKMMYDRAKNSSENTPKYLLLFGDGCFDNRGILLSSSSTPTNLILTYQKGGLYDYNGQTYDDYFGFLGDNATAFNFYSAFKLQLGVGRLPVSTTAEADAAVSKIAYYMRNEQLGSWKNRYALVADDNELQSNYHMFIGYAENRANQVRKLDLSVVTKKIYYDAYTKVSQSTGNRYPEVEDLIQKQFDDGCMLINYIGHSSYTAWSTEKTFKQNQAVSLTNKRMGVLFSASCEFSRFDSYIPSVGESLILNGNGGSVAVVATPRLVYASDNDDYNSAFLASFYSQSEDQTIGDVMRCSKNSYNSESRLTFTLLGDPALHLYIPTMQVQTDSLAIIRKGSEMQTDTVNALTHVRVFGHISNQSQLATNFNGKVNVLFFDKQQTLTTKGNKLNTDGTPYTINYTDFPNVLFSGAASVVDGQFSFDMIVPKDISYNYGAGRICYYAYDAEYKYEAKGAYENFIIGGSSDSVIADTVGPEISLYLNTSSFRSGDQVNASPMFYAEVTDESGINAAGAGIGHDITLTVDGGDPVILNSYFSYSLGSCSSGRVDYSLSDLTNGRHTLTFKAWDMLNNSSSRSVDFVVDGGRDAVIQNIVATPNPARSSVTITVDYDRPSANVDYRVRIYNLNGMLIKEESGSNNSTSGQLALKWNLTDSAGAPVNPGIYVYRVEIKADGADFVGQSEKIVVLPQ